MGRAWMCKRIQSWCSSLASSLQTVGVTKIQLLRMATIG